MFTGTVVLVFLLTFQFGLRHLTLYVTGENSLDIFVFRRIRLCRLQYSRIASAYHVGAFGLMGRYPLVHLENRLIGRRVVVHMKVGFVKYYVVSDEKDGSLCATVNQRLKSIQSIET